MDDLMTNRGSAMGTSVTDRAERILQQRVERNEQQQAKLRADLGGMHGDGGTTQEDLDDTRRLIESVRSDLDRSQRALARIEAGTYGQCTTCAGEIAAPRLAAIPDTDQCASCA
jgi:DnaK suppressor protein